MKFIRADEPAEQRALFGLQDHGGEQVFHGGIVVGQEGDLMVGEDLGRLLECAGLVRVGIERGERGAEVNGALGGDHDEGDASGGLAIGGEHVDIREDGAAGGEHRAQKLAGGVEVADIHHIEHVDAVVLQEAGELPRVFHRGEVEGHGVVVQAVAEDGVELRGVRPHSLLRDIVSAVEVVYLGLGVAGEAEGSVRRFRDDGVDLHGDRFPAGPGLLEEVDEAVAATADVEGVERLSERVEHVKRGGVALEIKVLEIQRVIEVGLVVDELVDDEGAQAGVDLGVDLVHGDVGVLAFALEDGVGRAVGAQGKVEADGAERRHGHKGGKPEEQGDSGPGARRRAGRHGIERERGADEEGDADDLHGAERGDKDKAGKERAEDAAEAVPGVERAEDAAGGGVVFQGLSNGGGGHGTEEEAGQEEHQHRVQEDLDRPGEIPEEGEAEEDVVEQGQHGAGD
jgi:hypothetical protein